jgi:hypothetical protein
MIAVIFELAPKPGLAQRYFDLADALKASLMSQDGFLSIERFTRSLPCTACVWPRSFETTACLIGLRRPLIL